MSTKNPFIAGNWVRGENFFGRRDILREILDGPRDYLWIAGTRRLGKTSLLKQLEFLTLSPPYSDKFIALFWDLQGSQNLDGLKESLLESVEDAEERFSYIGVEIDELENQDIFGILRTLKRKTRGADLTLLVLCDEAEELINIEKQESEPLPKLRRIFQQGGPFRTILTATKRLGQLEQSARPNTSPFLHGFIPPVYLNRLEDQEAERLVRSGGFDDRTVREIIEKTNQHPYLMQLICRRLFDSGDLQDVIEEVSADDMVAHFFAVDFQYLDSDEKQILIHILENNNITLAELQARLSQPAGKLIKLLHGLVQLGYVRHSQDHYEISNFFFEKWLQQVKEQLYTPSTLLRAQEKPREGGVSDLARSQNLPRIGDRILQHEILEKLGAGGMGVVYKARDTDLNRLVALKVLLPAITSDEEFRQRFLLEARAASSLNHPNITTIYQTGEVKGLFFISMEYVEGITLNIWRESHPDFSKKLGVAMQIAQGLRHAHQKDVVHRDIKPENIMVANDDAVKLMDFGLAKFQHQSQTRLTKSGTTLGTLAYMSPEQASGLQTDHRTDVFSFGVVLYELFAGQLPFSGEFELTILYSIVNEDPKPMGELNPDLPIEMDHLVIKALQKNREDRYQDMEALLADLGGLAKNP